MMEPILNESNVAWFSGLFDGEGCISIAKNGGTRLTIRMTDLDVIEQCNALFPGTKMQVIDNRPPRTPGGRPLKTAYTWRVSNPDAVREILNLMLPWLGGRRAARAREVLHHLDTRPGIGHWAKRTHCIYGHEFTPENTYIRKGTNHRRCRECMRGWSKDHRDRKKKLSLGQDISA